MKRSEWITIISMVVSVFAATMILSFKIGSLHEKIISLEKTMNQHTEELREIREDISGIHRDIGDIRTDIAKIRGNMDVMDFKLEILWRRQVDHLFPNSVPSGARLKAMQKTEVTQIVNRHYDELLSKVKSFKPQNARQAENLLVSIVGKFQAPGEDGLKLYEIALASGYDLDSLLFAAALSIRDKVVRDLGFSK